MRDEPDDKNLLIVDDASTSGMVRWAPLVVVMSVVGGFFALAWYAYHAGMQSVKEDDLLVIEADKTPMKERPADPGGMHFPNQDKTIFDTFAGNPIPPKVERVLPVPEEPMPKEMDTSDTSTWVNEKLHKHPEESAPSKTEKVIGAEDRKVKAAATKETAKKKDTKPGQDNNSSDRQVIGTKEPPDEEESETYVAHRDTSKPAQPVKPVENSEAVESMNMALAADDIETPAEEKPVIEKVAEKKEVVEKKAVAEKKEVVKPAVVAHEEPSAGKFMIQLGAYRSEQEARDNWKKMHLKHVELSDKSPLVIKADLGDKGIYYRLRVGGFAEAAEAKSLCAALTAKEQACILPTDK